MHAHGGGGAATGILLLPFAIALIVYGWGVANERRRGRVWPWHRAAAFAAGVAAAASSVLPVGGFTAHTLTHVMVGMLAPLLIVLSAPITLALRALHVTRARRLSRLLRSRVARAASHPVPAGVLSVGGMWVLYTTPLFEMSLQSPLAHWLVMAHTLFAGCLFTAALISLDPAPHRASFGLRIGVLVVALAAHGVLAKSLYAGGLPGVGAGEVQNGAMLMYYAGDVVDAALAVVLCAQWYLAVGRARSRAVLRSA